MLEFIRVTRDKDLKKKVKKLFYNAFPPPERIPPFGTICKRAEAGNGDIYGICEGQLFVGLAHAVTFSDVAYLYFLAVEESLRGKGYGGKILSGLKEIYSGKIIILNMEEINPAAENYEERLKRKQFYESNGFKLAGVKSREGTVIYDLMVYGGTATYDDYAQLIRNYMGTNAFNKLYEEIK